MKMVISNPKVVTGHNNCLIMKQMILEGLYMLVEISFHFEIVRNVEILRNFHHYDMVIARVQEISIYPPQENSFGKYSY